MSLSYLTRQYLAVRSINLYPIRSDSLRCDIFYVIGRRREKTNGCGPAWVVCIREEIWLKILKIPRSE